MKTFSGGGTGMKGALHANHPSPSPATVTTTAQTGNSRRRRRETVSWSTLRMDPFPIIEGKLRAERVACILQ
jgi:hypothetical protein